MKFCPHLRHALQSLEAEVQSRILETIGREKSLEKACRTLNRTYIASPGFYPVAHFQWRHEDYQCQLSHPEQVGVVLVGMEEK